MPAKKAKKGGLIKAGLSVGAMVAGATGAYMLLASKDAKKRQKAVKGFVEKAKKEIIKDIKISKGYTEDMYGKVVDKMMKKYEDLKKIDPKEFSKIKSDVKKHWKNIKKQMKDSAK